MENLRKHNDEFVKSKAYEAYATSKFPDKKTAIVSCMDTRLVTMLPAALGIKNGDVKMIKNAGGLVTDPFGDSMRSLLVAVYELGVENIMIIAHTNCGVEGMRGDHFLHIMEERGISRQTIEELKSSGHDLEAWLTGFTDTEKAVRESVELVSSHPLLPKGIKVEGYVIDTVTGKLNEVK